VITTPDEIRPGIKLFKHWIENSDYYEQRLLVSSVHHHEHRVREDITKLESAVMADDTGALVVFSRAEVKQLFTWSYHQLAGRGHVYMTPRGPKIVHRSALPRLRDLVNAEKARRVKSLTTKILARTSEDRDVVIKRIEAQSAHIAELSVPNFQRLLSAVQILYASEPIYGHGSDIDLVARYLVAGGSFMWTARLVADA
jgi:hypothetical protein